MANLYFEAQLSMDQIKRQIAELNQRFSGMADNVQSQGDRMDATYKRLGIAMASYFTFATAERFIGDLIRVRGEFQQLDIALETMLGNKVASDRLMAEVVELAAKTPFGLTQLGQGAKMLIAFKEPADQVGETLRRLGDLAAGASVPVEDLIRAYGKVSAKGKMQAEELNQFAERGIPIISELAKVVGKADAEIYKMAEKGEIGFGELQQAIKNMTSEGGQFFNLMEKQAASLPGKISNLGDAWDRMLNSLGQDSEGVLYGSIEVLTDLVENYETVIDILKVLAASYGTYKAALAVVSVYEKSAFALQRIQAFLKATQMLTRATQAQIAVSRALSLVNPYAAIGVAVGVIVASLTLFNRKTKEAASVSLGFSRDLDKEMKALNENYRVLKSTAEGTDARRMAIEKINSLYGDYQKNLLTEKSTLEEIEEAQKRATQALARNIAFKAQQSDLKNYEEFREAAEQDYSKALQEVFSFNNVPSEVVGEVSANLTKLLDEWSETNIKNRVGIGDQFANAFKEAGVQVDFFSKKGNDAYQGLFWSLDKVVNARQKERSVTEELNTAYDSYLKKLGLLDDQNADPGPRSGSEPGSIFNIEEFKKQLADQKKAYDEYFDAKRGAEGGDVQAVESYYSNLTRQGEDYEAFLVKQLEVFRDNVAAKVAIYQVAAKEGLNLNPNVAPTITNPLSGSKPNVKAVDNKSPYKSAADDAERLAAAAKRNEESVKQARKELQQTAKIDLANQLREGAYAAQDLAFFASQFDSNLGDAIGKIADIAGGISNIMTAKSPMQTAGAIFQVAGSITSLFDNSAQRQETALRKAEALKDMLELQNRALERQVKLMKEASGEDRLAQEAKTMAMIQKQQEDLLKSMRDLNKVHFSAPWSDKLAFDMKLNMPEGEEIEYLEGLLSGYSTSKMANAGFALKEKERIMELLDAYYEVEALQKQIMQDITGTTGESITNSIIEGFKQGKTAIEDFAQTFEDLMTNAVMETFRKQVVMKSVEGWYEKMAEYMDPQTSGGSLDEWEITDLLADWNDLISTSSTKFEEVKKLLTEALGFDPFASVNDDVNGIAGAIRRELTEETGSRLAGLSNVISLDIRAIREDVRLCMTTSVQQLNQLIAIEFNTGRTAVNTEKTVDRLDKAVKSLEKIASNTASNRRGEGW